MQADILSRVQEEVHRRVSVGAVRGCSLQCHAMDLLRVPQDRRLPAHHHQLSRLRHRDRLHRRLLCLRAEGGEGTQSVGEVIC